MSIAPIAIALVFGLLVSATLHFIFIWPAQEPPDESLDELPDEIVDESPD